MRTDIIKNPIRQRLGSTLVIVIKDPTTPSARRYASTLWTVTQ